MPEDYRARLWVSGISGFGAEEFGGLGLWSLEFRFVGRLALAFHGARFSGLGCRGDSGGVPISAPYTDSCSPNMTCRVRV